MAEVVKFDVVINDGIPSEIIAAPSHKRRRQTLTRNRKTTKDSKCGQKTAAEPESCQNGPSDEEMKQHLISEPKSNGKNGPTDDKKEVDMSNGQDILFEENETESNTEVAYVQALCQHQSIGPVDENFMAFIVQDYDLAKSCLLDGYVIIKRKVVKTPKELTFIYGCTCNPARQRLIDTLSATLPEELPDDLDVPYQKCYHIKALESIVGQYDKKTGFCMKKAFENENKPDDGLEDHSYDKSKPQTEVYGLENNQHVVCVRLQEEGQQPTYNIISINFKGKEPTLVCDCKNKNCDHIKAVQNHGDSSYAESILKALQVKNEWRQRYVPLAVSTKRIPFSVLPEEQKRNRFDLTSMTKDEDGAIQLIPGPEGQCSCGQAWGDEQCLENVNIYTDVDILPAKVYIRRCSNTSCQKWKEYDGGNDQVLFMGSYLVTHQVLRSYLMQFVTEGTTLAAFYKEWTWRQINSGNVHFSDEFSYNRLRYSWYSFLKLLDANYVNGFACPVCGDTPEIVVMDGVTLGVRKSFMPWREYLKSHIAHKNLDGSTHTSRVFIKNQEARRLLEKYCSKHLFGNEFQFLKNALQLYQPSLNELFEEFYSQGYTDKCPEMYNDFLLCLASNSPVCGLLHYHEGLFELLENIASGKDVSLDPEKIILLEQQIPILSKLLRQLHWNVPGYLPAVIRELVVTSKEPFLNREQHRLPACSDSCSCSGIGYFPTLGKVNHRGDYVLDDNRRQDPPGCTKRFGSHPSLTPGLFTLSCVHGICYGFQVMEDVESPNVPFTILRTRFHTAPKMVIYDNACNLHAYCLNRDPVFFRDTWFVVDRFHWVNHVGCHSGYNLSNYLQYRHLNTQVAEQRNATLKKLKSMLSYMNLENFINHLKLFMWFRSMVSLAIIAPDIEIENIILFKDLAKVFSKFKS